MKINHIWYTDDDGKKIQVKLSLDKRSILQSLIREDKIDVNTIPKEFIIIKKDEPKKDEPRGRDMESKSVSMTEQPLFISSPLTGKIMNPETGKFDIKVGSRTHKSLIKNQLQPTSKVQLSKISVPKNKKINIDVPKTDENFQDEKPITTSSIKSSRQPKTKVSQRKIKIKSEPLKIKTSSKKNVELLKKMKPKKTQKPKTKKTQKPKSKSKKGLLDELME